MIKLVLAGAIMWSAGDIHTVYTSCQFKEDIVFAGRVSDEDLQRLLGAAFAVSFVPTFEGFGLPVLEAMQCGAVVVSSGASLPTGVRLAGGTLRMMGGAVGGPIKSVREIRAWQVHRKRSESGTGELR